MKKSQVLIIVLISSLSGFLGAFVFNWMKGSDVAWLKVAENGIPSRVASSGFDLDAFESASAASTPTVVFIKTLSTVQYESPFGGFFWDFDPFGSRGQATSTGSGVIVNSDGYIVTNNHVIQGAEKITVVLNKSKKEYIAKVIGTDPGSDLALIKIEERDLPSVVFANSDDVKVGEWVLAVGNPFNLNSTVTAGIVSAKGRNINIVKNQFPIESFIQTDAAINPGNSGGALVNLKGQLVGINTAIQSNTGSYTGYGFAIPSNIVQKIVKDFIEKGEVQRAFTGFEIGSVSPEEMSALKLEKEPIKIKALLEDGPAEKSGLKRNDIIVKVGNMDVDGRSSFDEFLAYQRPGNTIPIEFIREGVRKKINLTLIDKKSQNELSMKGVVRSKYLGADFQAITASEKERLALSNGVKIMNIQRGGAISQMGLPNGFTVVEFNGKKVIEAEDLVAALEGQSGRIEIKGKDANGSGMSYSFFRY
jgi:serine protease Do